MTNYLDNNSDDAFHNVETFQEFMDKVNAYVISICGMSTDEIDDYHYRDCFEDGIDAEECGDEAMENAGFVS